MTNISAFFAIGWGFKIIIKINFAQCYFPSGINVEADNLHYWYKCRGWDNLHYFFIGSHPESPPKNSIGEGFSSVGGSHPVGGTVIQGM